MTLEIIRDEKTSINSILASKDDTGGIQVRFCLNSLRKGEMKNENKIQKNQIWNMVRMLTFDVKSPVMAKLFLKIIADFYRQVKNSESGRGSNNDLH